MEEIGKEMGGEAIRTCMETMYSGNKIWAKVVFMVLWVRFCDYLSLKPTEYVHMLVEIVENKKSDNTTGKKDRVNRGITEMEWDPNPGRGEWEEVRMFFGWKNYLPPKSSCLINQEQETVIVFGGGTG